ncbi:uncharacterized protein LOC130641476 [Hydractinia symbiolongicarpus]|nr:uncharacterized protein LOC130641476 [Hydractinia symbiolongicarpus]XP_057304271.1 uncharacterized protein LOC130641476 [Hydractinia symbiolongicarpus]
MRKEKKHKNLKQKLNAASTENFQENIKKYARWLEDKPMLVRIGNEDFVSKEIYYHGMCRVSYQSKAEKTPLAIQERNEKGMERQKLETSWHTARGIHCKAFEGVCAYIDDHILKEKDVILLSELKNQYHMLLAEIGNEAFEDIESSSAKLEQKLLKHYKESIQIMKGKTRRGNLIFCSTISEEEAFRKEYSMKTKLKAKIRDVAFALRSAIMEIEKCPIPDEVTFADIKKGEVEAPNELIEFFSYLIGGPDQRIVKSNQKQRRIKSIADDVIFAATSGKKKPAKHLQLGLAVKSITGSKKVIEMLNRLGHSVSYSIIEELETELTFTSTKAGNATPHGMKLMSSLGTGVAFDNFDRFVETLSGKDTLHDTVGIAYQVVSQNNDKSLEEDDDSTLGNSQLSGKKKRRSFLAVGLDIEPYRKKPKMLTRIMLPLDDQRRASEPLSYIKARMYDTLWMMDFYFSPDTTPMWVGWNSIIFQNTNNLQKVWYLPQINQSPTSIAVVAETLRRAQVIANECGKKNISVTYDLAIAKVAMQLQAEESPKFDNIFVALGAFHVEMAMFSAFGKYIAESGGPHILNEAGVIEKGSLKSFLLGKCYKRSK